MSRKATKPRPQLRAVEPPSEPQDSLAGKSVCRWVMSDAANSDYFKWLGLSPGDVLIAYDVKPRVGDLVILTADGTGRGGYIGRLAGWQQGDSSKIALRTPGGGYNYFIPLTLLVVQKIIYKKRGRGSNVRAFYFNAKGVRA